MVPLSLNVDRLPLPRKGSVFSVITFHGYRDPILLRVNKSCGESMLRSGIIDCLPSG